MGAPRLPRRLCGVCHGSFDVLHLLPEGGRLLCAPCWRRLHQEEVETSTAPEEGAGPGAAALFPSTVPRWLPGALLRLAFWPALFLWAGGDPFRSALAAGVLLGDLLTWAVSSVVEIPFHPVAAGVEVTAYLAVLHFLGVWRELLSMVEAGGVAVLPAALATAFAKTSAWWRSLPVASTER